MRTKVVLGCSLLTFIVDILFGLFETTEKRTLGRLRPLAELPTRLYNLRVVLTRSYLRQPDDLTGYSGVMRSCKVCHNISSTSPVPTPPYLVFTVCL
jgi:hypothetical protein